MCNHALMFRHAVAFGKEENVRRVDDSWQHKILR
jgi:hypothetical protein